MSTRMYIRKSIIAVLIVIMLGLAFCLGRGCSRVPDTVTEVRTDTLITIKTDTLWRTKKQISLVPQFITVIDTVYIHDTVLVRESKQYDDSLATIWISGIQAELDSVRYYQKEKKVLVEKTVFKTSNKNSGWVVTVGPYVGVGLGANNSTISFNTQVGLGVSVGWGWMIKSKK